MWVNLWSLRIVTRLNDWLHSSHLYGFSPVWINMCFLTSLVRVNDLSHLVQGYLVAMSVDPSCWYQLALINWSQLTFFFVISKSESQRSEISWTLVETSQNRGCGKDHETNCTQLFTRNRKFEIHGNRKHQQISMCGSIFLHANLVQNIVKVFWIFDNLVSQRGAIGERPIYNHK